MALFTERFQFEKATLADAPAIARLESLSYPNDEAATPEKIHYRIENAQDFFYTLKDTEATGDHHKAPHLVGFINGTCVLDENLHHECMSEHHSTGKFLVIHSVTIEDKYRRQKLASKMLQRYLERIHNTQPSIEKILLLSKPYLLSFYLANGFHFKKVSSIVHGKEQWIELELNLLDYFGIKQWVVDAFASVAFTGNPAAVVLTQKDDEWMQKLAMENNYAETSFVKHLHGNHFSLRW